MDEPIEKAVSAEEKILWKGTRNKRILNFYFVLGLILTLIISLLFFLNENISHDTFNSNYTPGHAMSIIAAITGIIISVIFYRLKKNYVYLITDKKTIIKKGGLNPEIVYIEHVDVEHIDMSKGLIGELFNVGSIYIDSGKKKTSEVRQRSIKGMNMNPMKPKIIYDVLKNIENPKKAFNLLERICELNKKSEQNEPQQK